MPGVAKVGDLFDCGDTIATGSGNVFVNGLPVATVGSMTIGHPCGPPTTIIAGATTVFANGSAVAIAGIPSILHGTCSGPPHPGTIVTASGNVNAT